MADAVVHDFREVEAWRIRHVGNDLDPLVERLELLVEREGLLFRAAVLDNGNLIVLIGRLLENGADAGREEPCCILVGNDDGDGRRRRAGKALMVDAGNPLILIGLSLDAQTVELCLHSPAASAACVVLGRAGRSCRGLADAPVVADAADMEDVSGFLCCA